MSGKAKCLLLRTTSLSIGALSLWLGNANAQEASSGDIEEIVVTATRREETLSRVPLSVSAFNQDSLQQQNIKSIDDLQRQIPGLVFTPGQNTIAIRGISSGAGMPTTGVYIDDSPIQILTVGFGLTNPVPIVFDLDRIEVLRGPQGTLFGAGAQGGVVRYITPAPSLTDYSFTAKAEVGFIHRGSEDFEVGVAGGGPILVDRLGFRASLYYNRTGGWVDLLDWRSPNNQLRMRDVNSGENVAGRAALAFAPSDNLTITPALQYQVSTRNNGNAGATMFEYWSDLSRGIFRSVNVGVMPSTDRWYLPTLKVEYDFEGFATLFSNTAYLKRDQEAWNAYNYYMRQYHAIRADFLPQFAATPLVSPAGYYSPLPNYSASITLQNHPRTFTQEVRLQSNDEDSPFTWLAGGFYTRTHNFNIDQHYGPNEPEFLLALIGPNNPKYGPDPFATRYGGIRRGEGPPGLPLSHEFYTFHPNGLPADNMFYSHNRVTDSQIAGFGEVSYNVTEELKVTVGARYSRTKFALHTNEGGPLVLGHSEIRSQQIEKPFTPKFGVSYQIDPDNMIYATVAKGFRIGGGNQRPPLITCAPGLALLGVDSIPDSYDADTTWSYEIGSKNRVLDGRASIATSVFYVKWSGIQQNTSIPICNFRFISNAESAVSKGFDIEVDANLFDFLRTDLAVGYTDAKYVGDVVLNPVAARPYLVQDGTPLPGPAWKVNLGLQHDFSLWDRESYVRANWQYTGQPGGVFPQQNPLISSYNPNIPKPPSTSYFTARAGMNFDAVDISIFIDNLLNSRKKLTRAQDSPTDPFTMTTWRPRTYVLSARYRY